MRTRTGALLIAAAALLLWAGAPRAAGNDPAVDVGGKPHRVFALMGATVVPRPGEALEGATVVLRDGLVAAVGVDVAIPGDARVMDMRGLTIYPGLIEPYLRLDPPEEPEEEDDDDARAAGAAPAQAGARAEVGALRPERAVAREAALDEERLKGLRKAGFTAALLAPGRGVFRGTSALVLLRDGPAREQVLRAEVAQHLAFEHGGWSSRSYPNSLMGAMAVTRQALFDAEHALAARAAYALDPMGQERPATDLSLEALGPVLAGRLPVCFEAPDTQTLLRGARLLSEFDLVPWTVLGRADAYRWLDELARTTCPVVLSLNAPPPPRWEGEDQQAAVELDALREWALAPRVPALLEQAQVRFAFTAEGLEDRAALRARVREAIARGLSETAALAALTTAPAAILRAPQLGVIAPGAIANLTVADGPLFAEHTRIVETWVDGARFVDVHTLPTPQAVAGTWLLDVAGRRVQVRLKHERGRLSARGGLPGEPGEQLVELDAPELWRDRLTFVLPGALLERPAGVLVRGRVEGRILRGTWEAGEELAGDVLGRLAEPEEKQGPDGGEGEGGEQRGEGGERGERGEGGERGERGEPGRAPAPVEVPDVPVTSPWPPRPEPAPPAVLVRGATVWSLGPQGTLEGADLLCRGGRVVEVGRDLAAPPDALVIDGRGLHVTPGLIDCHSHAFISGPVNESTRSCTAEARVEDVVDAETVHLYRQLAGGLTTANLLHGSANAIGGQSAAVQLRWGAPYWELALQGASPGIKWALGENPKRSNWGQGLPPRYPQSRMGVLEAIRERLQAARDYQRRLLEWRRDPRAGRVPPRIDLQLEALREVLAGERKVHCHSYRQDEILGLIRLAEEFGFTVGTFQHVLEGYKVADEIAAHGAGASTFSDWWAYKFEVYDAIAYNGALMHQRGVLVSFNSDSAELARRLNQEAGKAVRWGGLSEADALRLVTLNPALQLGVGDRLGSLEPGKQADFALWSAHPLDVRARCLETWIQGRRYYSRAREEAAHRDALAERAALLAAARAARYGEGGGGEGLWRPTFGGAAHGGHHGCLDGEEGR